MDAAAPGPALPFAKERKVGLEAVLKASEVCRRVQEALVSADSITKKDRSPVSVADFASQAILIHDLSAAFPEYCFIAEESSKVLKENKEVLDKVLEAVKAFIPGIDSEKLFALMDKGATTKATTKRWWTIDPIDGTKGFLRKGQYAVALALMEDNKPVVGFLGCPSLPLSYSAEDSPIGCVLVAVKGQGSYMQSIAEYGKEEKITVSEKTEMGKLVMTESPNSGHSSPHLTTICTRFGTDAPSIKIDSQCKYALIARGDAEVYLRYSGLTYKECIWDHAAGVIIVEEAGGVVTDINGAALDFSLARKLVGNTGILCTNAKLAAPVAEIVKDVNPVKLDSVKKD